MTRIKTEIIRILLNGVPIENVISCEYHIIIGNRPPFAPPKIFLSWTTADGQTTEVDGTDYRTELPGDAIITANGDEYRLETRRVEVKT